MKSECKDNHVEEAVCLRSKVYSLKISGGRQKMAAKGVPYSVQKTMTHDMYNHTYMTKTERSFLFTSIRSTRFQLTTGEYTRVGLSCYDDKRYVIDAENSVCYGYPLDGVRWERAEDAASPRELLRVRESPWEGRREKKRKWREDDVIQGEREIFRDRSRIVRSVPFE